jgi:hypothetical protein
MPAVDDELTGVASGAPVVREVAAPAVDVPASAGTVAEAAPALSRPRREIWKASWLVMVFLSEMRRLTGWVGQL